MPKYAVGVYEPEIDPGGVIYETAVEAEDRYAALAAALNEAEEKYPDSRGRFDTWYVRIVNE